MEKISRKKHIRRIAGLFLAGMLLLTLLSNTISKLMLPQVTVSKIQAGMIYNKVRGSGKVETKHYDVKLKSMKTVKKLLVCEGDFVSEKQPLFLCLGSKSEALAQEEEVLEELTLAYQKKLLQMESQYGVDDLAIKNAKEALQAANEKKQKAANAK